MKPKIDKTKFGSITIAGKEYETDILIRMNGKVEKRKKKLSKQVYGTSHMIALAEVEFIYEDGAEMIIIGSGQEGMVKLSAQAGAFLQDKKCKVVLLPTPDAILAWNEEKGPAIGLFHITC
jgi:hypothetical protein